MLNFDLPLKQTTTIDIALCSGYSKILNRSMSEIDKLFVGVTFTKEDFKLFIGNKKPYKNINIKVSSDINVDIEFYKLDKIILGVSKTQENNYRLGFVNTYFLKDFSRPTMLSRKPQRKKAKNSVTV